MGTKISTTALWTGRIMQRLLCLFLLFDSTMKIIKHSKSIEGTKRFGLPGSCVQFLGCYLLAATLLYIFPRTAIHGILLLIAYLGGATAMTYLSDPSGWGFIFPIVFTLLLVLTKYLQDIGFRSIFSLK